MKRIFILSALLMTGLSLAQVGINTTDPKATLEVASKSANDVGDVEGILIPRVSKQKALLMAGNTTTPVEESTMIYVNNLTDFTDPADGSEAAVSDITENGYYHWNGSKWVKVVGKNGELWTEITTQGGADYVNLKAAELNNDTIAYNSTNRHFYINLGNGDSSEDMWSDGAFGLPLNEIPKLSIVTSDVLPTESHIGSTGLSTGGYRFSSDVFLVHDEHANRNNNTSSNLKSYLGNSIRTIIPRGLTSPNIRSITGGEFASMSRSNISVGSITGGASVAINGADGVTQGEVDLLKGLNTWISNSGIAKSMLGSEVSVRNWGKAENIKGIRINTISQLSDTGLIPSHEVKRIYGIDNVTSISPNATVSEYARGFSNYLSVGEGANMSNTFYGAKNDVDIKENVILNRDLFGLQNTISIDSEVTMQPGKRIYVSWDALDVKSNLVDADVFVDRNAFKLSADNSSARHVNLNQSVMYSTAPSVTDLTGTFSAYSFWNANKENWTANKMYGVYLDPIINGQTANYGIYMENVGNTTSQNNYSIYTNAGKLRFGDLAGTGERIVTADADGVLSASDASSLVTENTEWVYDPTTERIDLKRSLTANISNEVYYDKNGAYKNIDKPFIPFPSIDAATLNEVIDDTPHGASRNEIEFKTSSLVLPDDIAPNYWGGISGGTNTVSTLMDEVPNQITGYTNSSNGIYIPTTLNDLKSLSGITGSSTSADYWSSQNLNDLTGDYSGATVGPNSTIGKVYAKKNHLRTYSSNSISGAYATENTNYIRGNGNIGSATGSIDWVVFQNQSTATVDNLVGSRIYLRSWQNSNPTINRVTGLAISGFVEDINTNSNIPDNIGSYKGIAVGNIEGGEENYAIYTGLGVNHFGDKVGIKNAIPKYDLDVNGTARVQGNNSRRPVIIIDANGNSYSTLRFSNAESKQWDITNLNEGGQSHLNFFDFQSSEGISSKLIIRGGTGNVGINTMTPSEKLEVAGNIKADAFYAAAAGNYFPDYVFEAYYNGESEEKADYNFKSLDTVESFIKENGHLPGYTSAKEVAEAGQFDMTATQLTNVEKIEELYLHTIEQEAKIKAQKEELQEKDAKIKALEARLERIEKLLEK